MPSKEENQINRKMNNLSLEDIKMDDEDINILKPRLELFDPEIKEFRAFLDTYKKMEENLEINENLKGFIDRMKEDLEIIKNAKARMIIHGSKAMMGSITQRRDTVEVNVNGFFKERAEYNKAVQDFLQNRKQIEELMRHKSFPGEGNKKPKIQNNYQGKQEGPGTHKVFPKVSKSNQAKERKRSQSYHQNKL